MKKIIAVAVLVLSMNALADHHQKHMVSFSGYESGNTETRSLDFTHSTGDNESNDNVFTRNIALNYAYAFTNSYQLGFTYKNFLKETNGVTSRGDESSTMGINLTYNFSQELADTNYLTIGYSAQVDEESDAGNDGQKTNIWNIVFGHRFSMGTVWGMNFNYSPSAEVAISSTSFDANQDDVATTAITLNFVKFDVLF